MSLLKTRRSEWSAIVTIELEQGRGGLKLSQSCSIQEEGWPQEDITHTVDLAL